MNAEWSSYIRQEFQKNLDLFAEFHFNNKTGYTTSDALPPLMKIQLLEHVRRILREHYCGKKYNVTTRSDMNDKNCYFIVVSIRKSPNMMRICSGCCQHIF